MTAVHRKQHPMTVTDTSTVDTVWVVEWQGTNWLAMLLRDDAAAPWRFVYRFRYFKDNKAWDSADERSWYETRGADGSDAERDGMRQAIQAAADGLEMETGGKQWKAVVDARGVDAFRAAVAQLPMFSMREKRVDQR